MFVSEAKISLISSSKRLVTTGWHDFVSINEETQKLSEPIDFNLYLHVYILYCAVCPVNIQRTNYCPLPLPVYCSVNC